jgi:hypothetical protein
MGNVADVSKGRAASIFGIELKGSASQNNVVGEIKNRFPFSFPSPFFKTGPFSYTETQFTHFDLEDGGRMYLRNDSNIVTSTGCNNRRKGININNKDSVSVIYFFKKDVI